jgi:hypothetical protein
MSDTPETDSQIKTFTSITKYGKHFENKTGTVSLKFARKLERERDEARKLAAELAFQKNQAQEECLEQARFLGKSAEREASLLGKLQETSRQLGVTLNALNRISESLAFVKKHAGKRID